MHTRDTAEERVRAIFERSENDHPDAYDIENLIDDLYDLGDTWDLSDVDSDDFWKLAEENALSFKWRTDNGSVYTEGGSLLGEVPLAYVYLDNDSGTFADNSTEQAVADLGGGYDPALMTEAMEDLMDGFGLDRVAMKYMEVDDCPVDLVKAAA